MIDRHQPLALLVAVLLAAAAIAGCSGGSSESNAETSNTGDTADDGALSPAPTDDEPTGNATASVPEAAVDDSSDPTGGDDTSTAAPSGDGYVASFTSNAGSDLYRLVADEVEYVASVATRADGTAIQLTDLALSPDGVLYGSTFTHLVTIDPASGAVTPVGPLPDDVNALAFLPDGRLLAADLEGTVSLVDAATAAGDAIGRYPAGLVSSGDIVVMPDGTVYATATTDLEPDVDTDGDGLADALSYTPSPDQLADRLLAIDPDTGSIEVVIETLPDAVYGLMVSSTGRLRGLVHLADEDGGSSGEIIDIDPITGTVESLGTLGFGPGGATDSPPLATAGS